MQLSKRNTDIQSANLLFGKKPPQAPDLEEAVLGAIMLEKNAIDLVVEYLKPDMFYNNQHQRIYGAMMGLYEAKKPIDLLTVVDELRKRGELNSVGGPYQVTKLTNVVVSSAHIEAHAKIITEKYLLREMISYGGELIHDGFDEGTDAFELVDKAEQRLFGISNGSVRKEGIPIDQLVLQSMHEIENAMNNQQDLIGVPTGFRLLDIVTYGWQQPDLIIIAARPSVGKTAFALNLAWNAVSHATKPTGVGVFSLEMSAIQLMKRLKSSVANVPLERLVRGRLTELEQQKLFKAASIISESNLHFDDSAALNIYELRSKARRMVSQHGVGMIIIDYLQLMNGLGEGRNMNREQEVSNISRSLKALAKELKIPVIALSQLSRDVEKRKDGKFQLSDLRESGAIEQDADFVGFLTRLDYQKTENDTDPAIRATGQLQIRKHRNGKLEDIDFCTDLSVQKWFDLRDYEKHMEASGKVAGGWVRVSDANKIFEAPPMVEDDGDDMPF